MTDPVFAVIVFTAHPENGPATSSFIKLDGRECFLRAIDPFLNRPPIQQMLATFTPDKIEEAKSKYASHLMFAGVKVAVGLKVFDQLNAARAKLLPEVTHVIVHDGARCCISYADVDLLIESAPKHEAIALTSNLNAPAIQFDEQAIDQPVRVIQADRLKSLLFPQVFSRSTFEDICVSRAWPTLGQLKLMDGHPWNLRLNHPGEAGLVKLLIGQLPRPKSSGPVNPFEEARW